MAWPWIPETRCGYALIRWGSAEIYTRLGRGIATRHRTSSLLEASKSVRSSFFFDKSDGITLGGSLRESGKQVISASGYTLPCVITPHHHDHSFVAFLRTPRFAGARLIKPPSPTVASTWFSQVTAACRTLSPTERVGSTRGPPCYLSLFRERLGSTPTCVSQTARTYWEGAPAFCTADPLGAHRLRSTALSTTPTPDQRG